MKRLKLDKETLRTLDAQLAATVVGASVFPPPTESPACGSGGSVSGDTSRTRPCPM